MTVTICLPATEVISIDAMASMDTVVWWCQICDHHGTATTRPTAHSDGIKHLSAEPPPSRSRWPKQAAEEADTQTKTVLPDGAWITRDASIRPLSGRAKDGVRRRVRPSV
jgi:hypothetical protein